MIAFLTDFGLDDGFVGICHGVMAGIAPDCRVIDVTHNVPRQDVRLGSIHLARAVPYLPAGIAVAVVDPGVGTARRPIAVRTSEWLFVGPDNGLLLQAANVTGGPLEAVELVEARFFRSVVSNTFHGRDIFCPVAAHLANGALLHDLGPNIDPGSLVALPQPRAEVSKDGVTAEVLFVDIYGNVHLAATGDALQPWGPGRKVLVQAGAGPRPARVVTTFGEAGRGDLLVYEDAVGQVSMAVNAGNAAAEFGVTAGDIVSIRVA